MSTLLCPQSLFKDICISQSIDPHHNPSTKVCKDEASMSSRRTSAAAPLLPSALPNEDHPRPASRLSSARASPALKDDLPLPESDSAANVPYVSVTADNLLPPRNFQPFFTLVGDTGNGEVAHPTVHYIFADDDPEVVTAASLRALGAVEGSVSTMRRVNSVEGEDLQDEEARRDVLPPLRPGVQERYVLVDMAQDGHTVVEAKSLSPEWAVTDTTIRNAPTFDGNDPDQAGSLMLKVEGMGTGIEVPRQLGGDPDKLFEERKAAVGHDSVAAMTQLAEELKKKMWVIDKVVMGGEEGTEEEP
jgi:hypothetical protein